MLLKKTGEWLCKEKKIINDFNVRERKRQGCLSKIPHMLLTKCLKEFSYEKLKKDVWETISHILYTLSK